MKRLRSAVLGVACCLACAGRAPQLSGPPLESAPSGQPPALTTAPAPPAASAEPAPATSPAPVLATEPSPEERLDRYRALWKSPRHRPAVLDEPARPAGIQPGEYACRVSQEYRLRGCRVERDADGRTFLVIDEGNLLAMRGVLYDERGGLAFEGWLTDEEPFGCTSCQDRCILDPQSCACDPLPEAGVVECLQQPLRMTFRATGAGKYSATLPYRVYYNEYVGEGAARHAEGYVGKPERFRVDLVRGKPPVPKRE
jgi:hypothetical protein